MADALEDESAAARLVAVADRETGLGEARLTGELARCANQLRFYADVAVEGSWLGATVDPRDPGVVDEDVDPPEASRTASSTVSRRTPGRSRRRRRRSARRPMASTSALVWSSITAGAAVDEGDVGALAGEA